MGAAFSCALLSGVLSGCVGISLNTQERPFGRALDDMGTRTELNARLLGEDPQLFANVSTTVIEGRVHLAGSVMNEADRQKAAELAWASPNVVEVVNNIEVTDRGGVDDIANDRWISAQVRAKIVSDPGIRDINYSIDTQNSVVFVMGIGQNPSEIERVLTHARGVAGVRSVVNYVVTKDDPRRMARATAPAAADQTPPTLYGNENQRTNGPDTLQGGSYVPEPVEVEPLGAPETGTPEASAGPRSLLE